MELKGETAPYLQGTLKRDNMCQNISYKFHSGLILKEQGDNSLPDFKLVGYRKKIIHELNH